jgi:hypothetical protein
MMSWMAMRAVDRWTSMVEVGGFQGLRLLVLWTNNAPEDSANGVPSKFSIVFEWSGIEVSLMPFLFGERQPSLGSAKQWSF